ncbi:hypothetical protein [Nocardia yamanashiensis]|uniref:hypothetical protein n=1 Tax=Nocardia yamanashiensis TaxID=209247 RepID=UPI000AE6CE28|nr:hypothetical protein [Nocardia yamanashiensis]
MSKRYMRTDQVERLVVPNGAAAEMVSRLREAIGQHRQLELDFKWFNDGDPWAKRMGPLDVLEGMLDGQSLRAIAGSSDGGEVLNEYAMLMDRLRLFLARPDQLSPNGRPWQDGDVDAEEFAAFLRRLRVSRVDTVLARVLNTSVVAKMGTCWSHDSPSALLVLRRGGRKCPQCPCWVPANPPSAHGRSQGRPRVYCSDGCRQRAYRRRKASVAGEGEGSGRSAARW